MARWKARVDVLLSVIGLLFLSLTADALQGKTRKRRCFQERWVSLNQNFRGSGRAWGMFLVSTKLDTFCYLHHPAFSRFDIILTCDRQTDRQTGERTELM